MRKILITGITGFIGSHLASELDGEIHGLVEWSHQDEACGDYQYTYGDLRDYSTVRTLVSRVKPEIVLHLGAITPVSLSFDRPHQYVEVNMQGTVNLAEANLHHNPRLEKFIYAGTPEEYGRQEDFPITEGMTPRPQSPYAVSKLSATKYLLYLYDAYDFPAVIPRHANCYGRKRNTHFVVETIMHQMMTEETADLGDPDPVREFLYITDVVAAYRSLLEHGDPGEIYNLSGRAASIRELAETIGQVLDFEGDIRWHTRPPRPGTVPRIELDDQKARTQLEWEPQVPLEDGIRQAAQYWSQKENPSPQSEWR